MAIDLKKQCAHELKKLLPNITASDKLEACQSLSISRVTLDKYLKGTIANVDLGIKMIQFFAHKVENRIGQLNNVA